MFDMVLHADPVFNLAIIEPINANQLRLRFAANDVAGVAYPDWQAMTHSLTQALDRAIESGLVSQVQYRRTWTAFEVVLTR